MSDENTECQKQKEPATRPVRNIHNAMNFKGELIYKQLFPGKEH